MCGARGLLQLLVYLIMIYILAVVHDTLCIPSLTSSTMYERCVLNSVGALF